MRSFIFILSLTCLLSLCSQKSINTPTIIVRPAKEVIVSGEIFKAEISISDYADSVNPLFYIISNNDTFYLPFDEIKKCGVYKSIGRKTGDKKYDGFVEYVDLKGKQQKSSFTIQYKIADSLNIIKTK